MASETVINDRYSRKEYIQRRAGFLSKHPDYETNPAIFPTCHRDADDVFKPDSEKLSVQEVQRREVAAGIDPVLPLPTTANMQTLDSFASYPTREWSPSLEKANNTRPLQQTRGPPFSPFIPNVATSATTTRHHRPANLDLNMPTTTTTRIDPSAGQLQPSDPDRQKLLQDILAALDPTNRAMTSPLKSPASSLSGRGIRQPVKQLRGTKRLASEPLERTDSVFDTPPSAMLPTASAQADANGASSPAVSQDSDPAAANPRKRVKLNLKGPRRDISTPPSPPAATKPVQQAPRKQPAATNPVTKAPRKQPAATRPASKTPRKGPASTKPVSKGPRKQPAQKQEARTPAAAKRLQNVINGAVVAKTKQEARGASDMRHQNLLAAYMAAEGITDIAEADEPDFMPEFFNPAAFEDPDNEVRCTCGVTHDDGGRFVGCDGTHCQVWQHVVCMSRSGNAVPRDLDHGTYLCQMCDPWAHREHLRELRAGMLR